MNNQQTTNRRMFLIAMSPSIAIEEVGAIINRIKAEEEINIKALQGKMNAAEAEEAVKVLNYMSLMMILSTKEPIMSAKAFLIAKQYLALSNNLWLIKKHPMGNHIITTYRQSATQIQDWITQNRREEVDELQNSLKRLNEVIGDFIYYSSY
jgi:hypothetical protein